MTVQGYSSGIFNQLYRNYDNNNPENLKEWTEKRIELVKKIKNIDSQLANKNMLADDGGRLGEKAYFQRRQKLIESKNEIEQKLLDLNAIKYKFHSTISSMPMSYQNGDPHAIILTLLREMATSLKHIQFLLHSEWTD